MIFERVDVIHKMEYLNHLPSIQYIRKAINAYPNPEWDDVLSWGQLKSKQWLIETLSYLDYNLGTIFVMGGWYGSLPLMMFRPESNLRFDLIRSFDIDPTCAPIAETLNRVYVKNNWKFKATTADMFNLSFNPCTYRTKRTDGTECELNEVPNTIINTSSEHINLIEWTKKITNGTLVVLQSNNLTGIPEHINCVKNEKELAKQADLSKVLFSEALDLPDYTRFMVIGIK